MMSEALLSERKSGPGSGNWREREVGVGKRKRLREGRGGVRAAKGRQVGVRSQPWAGGGCGPQGCPLEVVV